MTAVPLLLAAALLLPAAPTLRDDPAPSADAVSESVTTYSPDKSVTTWSIEGSVTSLAETTTKGPVSTLTLGTDVLFAFGKDKLDPAAAGTLTKRLADVPRGAKLSVVGYTDSIGTTASNLSLSKRRAQAVVAAVAGTRPDLQTTATGRGESNPVADNGTSTTDNPAGRAKNRRVELTWNS